LLRAVARYFLIDKNRNEDTMKELHVTDVITRINDCQTKWWEHVERMESQRISTIFANIIQLVKEIQEDRRRHGKISF